MIKKLIFYIFLIFNLNNICADKDCFTQSCVSCEQCEDTVCKSKDGNFSNKTFFSIRPQDSNSARRILNQIDKLLFQQNIMDFSVTYEYQTTFNRKNSNRNLINWFLFDNKNCLTIGENTDSEKFDIDEQQLGLLTINPFAGKICFKPKLKSFIADLQFRFNYCGLWLRIGLPIVQTKVNLNSCVVENNVTGSFKFPAGLFATNCQITKSIPNLCQAFEGTQSFGSVPKLKCGKFSFKELQQTALAGINFSLGYDFIRNICDYVGLGIYFVAPTGTRPNDKFILEPVIGANKSWQLGLEFYSGTNLISTDYNTNIAFYTDLILTHLFKAKQTRLFALKNNGPLSQFLLVKKFDAIGSSVVGADRVGNILCGKTEIGANLMFDGSIMLQISKNCWFANIGYNLWARTEEKRNKTVCFRNFAEDVFGIKGHLPISEETKFDQSGCGEEPFFECISNLDTASKSKICNIAPKDSATTLLQISDIDFNAPLHPSAISNKLFGSFGYNIINCNYPKFLQIAGEVEFGRNNAALDQWGVLFTFGMLF